MLLDDYSKWLDKALFPVGYGSRAHGWDLVVKVHSDEILSILSFLQNSANASFKVLSDLAVIDRPSNEKRFSIVYNLLSLKYQCRLFLRLCLSEGASVPSVVSAFAGADWMEREA